MAWISTMAAVVAASALVWGGLPQRSLKASPPPPATALAQAASADGDTLLKQAADRYNQAELVAAAALLEPALAAFTAAGDTNKIQQAASFLGLVYGRLGDSAQAAGDLAGALTYYEAQISALEQGYNPFAQAQALIVAGSTARASGRSVVAETYLQAALEIALALDYSPLIQQARELMSPR